jgi:preprotein translocase subunit SecA
MSTQTSSQPNLDVGLWERFTDGLSAFSEGIVNFLGRLFGSSNERLVRAIGYIRPRGSEAHTVEPGSTLDQVNALEATLKALRDDEFEQLTAYFRGKLGVEHKPLPKKVAIANLSVPGSTDIKTPPSTDVAATTPAPASPQPASEAFTNLVAQMDAALPQSPTLDDILPYAFAACREIGLRTKNMRHFDVQIVGGVVLHQGKIAEMVTGEGKTLVATLPAYLNALMGKGIHVVTVNDYLARRDCEWMSPIYHGLGISCGFIQSDMDSPERRKAYDCDITYGTNSEFGFDYLRDNMKPARWADPSYPPHLHQCQRALNYAIIDEVDNILIDEARTPLIISGQAHGNLAKYADADRIAIELTRMERKAQEKLRALGHGINIPDHPLSRDERPDVPEGPETGVQEMAVTQGVKEGEAGAKTEGEGHVEDSKIEGYVASANTEKKEKRLGFFFEVKEKERSCHLTDEGIRKAEELAGVESFYTAGNMEWPHLIDNALKAHHLYHRDKQYMIGIDPDSGAKAIIIVDEFTGRPMHGRQWSDGLHQAVEAKHAKEGVRIKEETQTLATITLQNYFKLYKKLAGMTGTAMTEANEFWKIYKLDVVAIPTNQPLVRINYPDLVYLTEKEKWDAVVGEIERTNKFDTIHMKDGTTVVGNIKKEEDESLEIIVKDTREAKTIKADDIDHIDVKGRPILVGTTNVAHSEKLAKMLQRRGVKHELLNAKPEFAGRESEIVAQAGRIGAVTISTNMAGRGTDIILGGNAETLAWARLKDKYATRLDVPDDIWKNTVGEIRAKENMEAEGRQVASMGGLHIIGTERHESRRIDNQLRGRAGRQGDPGSSRFFLSLQDELMRVFAGEWVASVLTNMGMAPGEAIESGMVTRRIEAAQKKVEEHNFDIRKNLLEYDEVMDHQRKRVYGYRQEILNDANPKIRVQNQLMQQIDMALDRYLDPTYGAGSFAELVVQQLSIDVDASDFGHSGFDEADQVAREKALNNIQTQIQEALDENLDEEVEQTEWNWQAMADRVNKLWDLKATDKSLKKIGRENLSQYLFAEAEKVVHKADLSKGRSYLQPDWNFISLCTWFDLKFHIKIDSKQFDADMPRERIRQVLVGEVKKLYREKETEFPVAVAMARFMNDKGPGGAIGQKYNREGLFHWYTMRLAPRLPALAANEKPPMVEEDFRTESRANLLKRLTEISRRVYPTVAHDEIDAKLGEAYAGAKTAEADDAQEISEWAKAQLDLDVSAETLIDVSLDKARDILWNAFDSRYRPEMRRMERSLLLNQLDSAWKNHLWTIEHVRSGIGLVGYAQVDPKTEFKRVGMKEFDGMWANISDKVTDIVFRMEDDEAFDETVWVIGQLVHEAAPRLQAPPPGSIQAEQQDAIQGSQTTDKKQEPIRNRGEKVGRNDPCPCGSGKKYKNCHMRHAVK